MGSGRRIDLIVDVIIDIYAERTSHAQRGVYPIFVKAVKPIGTRKMQAMDAADLRPALLCAQGLERVDGVVVDEAAKNFVRVNLGVGVEGDAVIFGDWKRLQTVHVIGHGDGAVTVAGVEMQEINSMRLGASGRRGRSASSVWRATSLAGSAKSLQDLALGISGIFDQRKDTVAIGGKDGVVEAHRGVGVAKMQGDSIGVASYGADLRV